MKKKSRFSRQFNRACAEFRIFDGPNNFLVPIDADPPHLLLLIALKKRCDRDPHSTITAVHLYATAEPMPSTVSFLAHFCQEQSIAFASRRVEPCGDRIALKKSYYDTAVDFNAAKVAVVDSLDYIDATLLSNMAFEGIFSGPSVCEPVQIDGDRPPVTFVRPLCLLTDAEIEAAGREFGFESAATGIALAEEPFMSPAREAIAHMLADGNVRLNFFNAQFRIEKKYVGDGTSGVVDECGA
jgi:hypothetical protein